MYALYVCMYVVYVSECKEFLPSMHIFPSILLSLYPSGAGSSQPDSTCKKVSSSSTAAFSRPNLAMSSESASTGTCPTIRSGRRDECTVG